MSDSTTKRCSKCERDLPLSAFPKNRARKDGVGVYCTPCWAAYVHDRRVPKPRPIQTPEQRRAYINARRASKIEEMRAYDREWKQRAYDTNPDPFIARVNQRHARKQNNGGSFTVEEWNELKAHYDYRCLCCGKCEPKIKLTIDHVIPLTKGGSSDISNIQPLCRTCNSSKNARTTDYRFSRISHV